MADKPSAAAVERTPEQEVMELNKLTFRLAQTKDKKMQPILAAVLPTVLGCLDPKKPKVQAAAVKVISHVMKRVKASNDIKLPCKELIDAMNMPGASSFTKNFAVMLLDLGLPKLGEKELAPLFSSLVMGLTRHAAATQEKFLRMTLKCLAHVNARLSDENATKADIKQALDPIFAHVSIEAADSPMKAVTAATNSGAVTPTSPSSSSSTDNSRGDGPAAAGSPKSGNPHTALPVQPLSPELSVLLDFFLDVMLYSIPPAPQHVLTASAGLSVAEVTRILGPVKSREQLPTTSQLRGWKTEIVEFVSRVLDLVGGAHLTRLFVTGSVLAPNEVEKRCRSQLKSIQHKRTGLENRSVVTALMRFCVHGVNSVAAAAETLAAFGSGSAKKSKKMTKSKAGTKASAPHVGIRVRIVDLLCLSTCACSVVPGCIEVASTTAFGGAVSTRLQQSGLKFLTHLFANANAKLLTAVSPTMFKGLHNLVKKMSVQVHNTAGPGAAAAPLKMGGSTAAADLKSKDELEGVVESLFMAVAQLARCQPNLFSTHSAGDGIAMTRTLLHTMASVNVQPRIRLAARGALAAIRGAFVASDDADSGIKQGLSLEARKSLLNVVIEFTQHTVQQTEALQEMLVDWLHPRSAIFFVETAHPELQGEGQAERDTIQLTAVFCLLWLSQYSGPVQRSALAALSVGDRQGGDDLLLRKKRRAGKDKNDGRKAQRASSLCEFPAWLSFLQAPNIQLSSLSRTSGARTPSDVLLTGAPQMYAATLKFTASCLAFSGKSDIGAFLRRLHTTSAKGDSDEGGQEKRIRRESADALTDNIIVRYHDLLAGALGLRTASVVSRRPSCYSLDDADYLPVLQAASSAIVMLYQECPRLVAQAMAVSDTSAVDTDDDTSSVDHVKFLAQHHDGLVRRNFCSILALLLRSMPPSLQRQTVGDLVNAAKRVPDQAQRFLKVALARGTSLDICAHGSIVALGQVVSQANLKKSGGEALDNAISRQVLADVSAVVLDRILNWKVTSSAAAISHQRKRALVVACLDTMRALVDTRSLRIGAHDMYQTASDAYRAGVSGTWKLSPSSLNKATAAQKLAAAGSVQAENRVAERTTAASELSKVETRIEEIKKVDDYDQDVALVEELKTLRSRRQELQATTNSVTTAETAQTEKKLPQLPAFLHLPDVSNLTPGCGPAFATLLEQFGGAAAVSEDIATVFYTNVGLSHSEAPGVEDLSIPALVATIGREGARVPCIYLATTPTNVSKTEASNAAGARLALLEGQVRGTQLVWQLVEFSTQGCPTCATVGEADLPIDHSQLPLRPPSVWFKTVPAVAGDSGGNELCSTAKAATDVEKEVSLLQGDVGPLAARLVDQLAKMIKSSDVTIARATVSFCAHTIVSSLLTHATSAKGRPACSVSVFNPFHTVLLDQMLDRCRSKYEDVQRAVGRELATVLTAMASRDAQAAATSAWPPCDRHVVPIVPTVPRVGGAVLVPYVDIGTSSSSPGAGSPGSASSSSKNAKSPSQTKPDVANMSGGAKAKGETQSPRRSAVKVASPLPSKNLMDYSASMILEHVFNLPIEAKMGRAVGLWLMELLIAMKQSRDAHMLWPRFSLAHQSGTEGSRSKLVVGVDAMLKVEMKLLAMLRHRDAMCTEEAARGLVLLYRQADEDDADDKTQNRADKAAFFLTARSRLLQQLTQDLNIGQQLKQSGSKNKGKWAGKTTIPPVYRELYALARELGNTALIYEFLPAAVASGDSLEASEDAANTGSALAALGAGPLATASALRDAIFGTLSATSLNAVAATAASGASEETGSSVAKAATTLKVAAAVSEEIDRAKLLPYMDKLVPRLFVLRNTPDGRVRRAVRALWTVLVDDSSAAIAKHNDIILRHCLKAMNDPSWLRRCAGSTAVMEALSGRAAEDVIYMETLTEDNAVSENTDFLTVCNFDGDRSACRKRDDSVQDSRKAVGSSPVKAGKSAATGRSMYLLLLWTTVLRSVDDARKESRAAGTAAALAVKRFIERATNRNSTSPAICQFTVDRFLPFLLEKGIYSSAKESRFLSIDLLRTMVRDCGDCVAPHAVLLTCSLLESLSSLESSRLVYLQQQTHTDRLAHVENAESKVESIRLQVAKQSPMQETLDVVMKFIGLKEFQAVMPKLATILKRGVGLATRVAAANFVQALMDRFDTEHSKPFAQAVLRSVENGVRDQQSAAVRKAYARTAASAIRRAKTGTVKKFLAFLTTWAMEGSESASATSGPISSGSDTNVSAALAGQALYQIVRHASKATARFIGEFLPVTFVMRQKSEELDKAGRRAPSSEAANAGGASPSGSSKKDAAHEKHDSAGEEDWDAVWELCVPGTMAGIRLHIDDIVNRGILPSLGSSRWMVKQKAGLAVQEICRHLQQLDDHCIALVDGLDAALNSSRNVWVGKEELLLGLSTILCRCGKLATDKFSVEKFAALLSNEARKAGRGGALEYTVQEGFAGAKQGQKVIVLENAGSSDPHKAKYVRHIFTSFEALSEAFADEDFWTVARAPVFKVVRPPTAETNAGEAEGPRTRQFLIPPILQACGLACFGKCWRPAGTKEGGIDLTQVDDDLGVCADAVRRGPWAVTVAALSAMQKMFSLLPAECIAHGADGLASAVEAVQTALESLKYSKVREAAVLTAAAFVTSLHTATAAADDGGVKASEMSQKASSKLLQTIVDLQTANGPVAAEAMRTLSTLREAQIAIPSATNNAAAAGDM